MGSQLISVFTDNIDAGIHCQTAQQHHRCKAARTKLHPRQPVGKECSDERYWDERDNGQWQSQRLKQDAAYKEDNDNDKTQEPVLRTIILIIAI